MPQTILANRIDEGFLNPRQEAFLKNYLDPQSSTFSNITQSGIKAGFSPEYSEALMALMPNWLADNLGDAKRLRLAEDNLDALLTQSTDIKVKADMTKFALSTMGRRKYSTRTETDVTSAGQPIGQINYIVPADATIIPNEKIIDAEIKPDEIIPKQDETKTQG
jgi:hypothetical protein